MEALMNTGVDRVRTGLGTGLAAVMIAVALAGAAAPAAPAFAQSLAADKAVVDAAKAKGEVGEQSDGFLGVVQGGDASVAAAVAAINAGRASAYKAAAEKAGTGPEAAGAAAGQQLTARVPPGQYYRTAQGAWVRR
jgi:uncharacterized protein